MSRTLPELIEQLTTRAACPSDITEALTEIDRRLTALEGRGEGAVEAEREACARIADSPDLLVLPGACSAAVEIGERIRARAEVRRG